MQTLNKPALLLESIVPLVKGEYMSVIDVGCSRGIDALWRVFEPNLSVHAFDPALEECDRLRSAEKNPEVRYIPGFVGIEPHHPFLISPKAGHTGREIQGADSRSQRISIIHLRSRKARPLFGEKLSYHEFIRRFAADDPHFY
jgi:hypothetical protein